MHPLIKFRHFFRAIHGVFKDHLTLVKHYSVITIIFFVATEGLLRLFVGDRPIPTLARAFVLIAFFGVSALFFMIQLYYIEKKNPTAPGILAYLDESSDDVLKTYSFLDSFHHLILMCLDKLEESVDDIIVSFFEMIMQKVDEADCGSVYRVEEDRVVFLKAVGYDVDVLNKTPFRPSDFKLQTYNVMRDQTLENNIKDSIGESAYQSYTQSSPSISESIHIGVISAQGERWGVSIDISHNRHTENGVSFSQETINELKELQTILSYTFRLREISDMKSHLQKEIVRVFVIALENHDPYTKGHSDHVSELAVEIGQRLGLNAFDLNELMWASIVHDIGKIAIPTEILNKPTQLSDEEYAIIKQHPALGASYLEQSPELGAISNYVRHHHERYDGRGYPDGLIGEDIPLISRIISVADSWDAMTRERPYRKTLTHTQAIDELNNETGKQFCPKVIPIAINLLSK